MKCSLSIALAALSLALLAHAPARAMRAAGDLPRAPAPVVVTPPPAPPTGSGVIAAVRASSDPRGVRVQIDGRWWLVLDGRTSVLRDGRLVGAEALAVGQAVRFTLATATPGETALGIVHVP